MALPKITEEILELALQYDFESEVYWNRRGPKGEGDFYFFIICNDQFYWGAADGEEVTEENLPLLAKSLEDIGPDWGLALFCSRSRKMRPQGALYAHIPKELWHWFDESGPEREVNPKEMFGNPFDRGVTIGKDARS